MVTYTRTNYKNNSKTYYQYYVMIEKNAYDELRQHYSKLELKELDIEVQKFLEKRICEHIKNSEFYELPKED